MIKRSDNDYRILFAKHKKIICNNLLGGMALDKLVLILSEIEGTEISKQIFRQKLKDSFYVLNKGRKFTEIMYRGDTLKGVKMPKPNQCKWYNPDWTLCNNEIKCGSFCSEHAKVCYKEVKK